MIFAIQLLPTHTHTHTYSFKHTWKWLLDSTAHTHVSPAFDCESQVSQECLCSRMCLSIRLCMAYVCVSVWHAQTFYYTIKLWVSLIFVIPSKTYRTQRVFFQRKFDDLRGKKEGFENKPSLNWWQRFWERREKQHAHKHAHKYTNTPRI